MSYCVYCCFADLGAQVYPVKRRQRTYGVVSAGVANIDAHKALPVWKSQNARRGSRKQNGAFFH